MKNTSTFIGKDNKRILKVQGKSNVVYISSYKKRNKVKPYTKTDDDWYNIIRANDGDRKVSFKAARLISKLLLELHKNNNLPIYKDNYWFSKIINVYSRMQKLRLRNQLSHIFNFEFHKIIIVDGALLKDVYKISFTENAYKVLNFEDVKIDKKDDKINASDPALNKLNDINKNVTIPQQKCYAHIDNKALVEEEPKVHSSTNADNEKLKIKNSESQSIEKSSCEDDFPIPANDSNEKSKLITANEEKKHYQSHNMRSSYSGGFSILQIQILETELINEDTEMKAQVIPLKPERNMQQELHEAIYKVFGTGIAGELITRCQFISESDRFGIKIGQGVTLSNTDKEKLRSCIRAIYGKNINIVSLNQPNTELKKEEDLQSKVEEIPPSEIPQNESCLLWRKFQKGLQEYYINRPEVGKHAMTAWFSKLKATQILSANKLILTGTSFIIDYIQSNQASAIEYIAEVNKLTIELHHKNNKFPPTIFLAVEKKWEPKIPIDDGYPVRRSIF